MPHFGCWPEKQRSCANPHDSQMTLSSNKAGLGLDSAAQAITSEQAVLQLQVAVDDQGPLGVQVGQALCDLDAPLHGLPAAVHHLPPPPQPQLRTEPAPLC